MRQRGRWQSLVLGLAPGCVALVSLVFGLTPRGAAAIILRICACFDVLLRVRPQLECRGVANSGFGGAVQVGGAPLRKFRMQISEWVESE